MARRLLRILGVTLVVLVGVAGAVYLGLVFATNRMLARTETLSVPVNPIPIPVGNPEAIARGQYLVDHVMNCKICHASDFGGRAEVDDPMVGTLYGPNLTMGNGSAVSTFTPTDWARAIRHGLAQNGRRLILMPSEDFFNFSNEDIGAVVAYIKSMPLVDRPDRGITLRPLGRVLLATGQVRFAFDKIDHGQPRPVAAPSDTKEWGSVLIGACAGCHGPELSGGPIPGTPPDWPPARNLTLHETGTKGWTYEQFAAAVRTGRRPDGTVLQTQMPWQAYAGMTDSDVQALWAYIQTVPPKPFGGH